MLSISTIQAYFERRNLDFDNARQYGEPGYSTDKPGGILFANWNHVPKPVMACLERYYECEWSDEWYIDHENNSKAYRTSPDSYGWTPSIVWGEDGEPITPDDLERDPEAFLDYLINSPRHAMTSTLHLDLSEHGFTLAETDLETGWHPGQTDDPKAILAKLQARDPDVQVIFDVTDVGQSDARWQVWTRRDPEAVQDSEDDAEATSAA